MVRSVALGLRWAVALTLLFPTFAFSEAQGSTRLHRLYVTVTRNGKPAQGLKREDFTILEDEVRQDLATFELGDSPFAAVLLLDASASMSHSFEELRPAIQSFLSELGPRDEIMSIVFAEQPLAMTSFLRQGADLTLESKDPPRNSNTSLNDHLYAALDILHDREGRHVVILISDGADLSSVLRMEDVLWKTRRSDALIYWIHPRDPDSKSVSPRSQTQFSTSWHDVEANSQERKLLAKAVEESGGRSETVMSVDGIKEAFGKILRELRGQYILGYLPSHRGESGQWKDVKVRLRSRGTKVRAQEGYVEDDPEEGEPR